MRLLKLLALLATVACAPTQREQPVLASTRAGAAAVAARELQVAPGDLGAERGAPEPTLLEDSANAKAAGPALEAFAGPVVPPEETVVRVLLYHGIGARTSRPVVKARA